MCTYIMYFVKALSRQKKNQICLNKKKKKTIHHNTVKRIFKKIYLRLSEQPDKSVCFPTETFRTSQTPCQIILHRTLRQYSKKKV